LQVKPDIPRRIKWNKIIVVGEAPGREEDKVGKPFVGQAGQLLNEMLDAADINRRCCVVINPFIDRPPSNNIGHFFAGTPYRSAVLREYVPHIKQFNKILAAHAPAMILAMGRTAAWALNNYTGTLADRFGKILPTDHGLVMFLYHPSYFSRGKLDEVPKQIKQIKLARLIAQKLI
jgi:DNA polymerase